MKIEFSDHDEHQKFMDSGTSITDALDANGVSVEDIRCSDANCPGENQEDEKDDDEDGDERSAYRMVNGQVEVRERKP